MSSGPQGSDEIPSTASDPKHDNRVTCFQSSSLPSTAELCQTQWQSDNSDENEQFYGGDIYQKARRHTQDSR